MDAAKRSQEEEEDRRKMQDEIVTLHQQRCEVMGLDPTTTPVVDVSGHYFLDPATIQWKLINLEDPTLPAELLLLIQAALSSGSVSPPESPEIEMEEVSVDSQESESSSSSERTRIMDCPVVNQYLLDLTSAQKEYIDRLEGVMELEGLDDLVQNIRKEFAGRLG